MASKKFAHWNGFPFMTAPRTKYYSGQTQSPLFRLSREIRDIIYGYYTLGEGDNGYHYDSETGKMLEQSPSSEPKRIVRLGLMITCRIAAEELKNCAFRKLQFSPHLSQDDGQAFLGLASRAGRFQSLLRYVDRQKRRMLIKVAGLLQDEDWLDLHDRFPSVQGWFKRCLMHSVATRYDQFGGTAENRERLASISFSDALQHVLVLAKNRNPPMFARLACTMFGMGRCPLDGGFFYENNYFIEGALYDIFSWHPNSWSLPNDDELSRLEALICMPGDTDTRLSVTDDGTFYFSDVADHLEYWNLYRLWCFSAASTAIDFLQKLPRQKRDNMHTIILNETRIAASRPEHHARGLIPFCRENPKLQIERRLAISASRYPEPCSDRGDVWDMSGCFQETMLWIEAALELSTLGMPAQSYTLVIYGGSDFWQVFKHAAALQEATYELLQRKGRPIPPRPHSPQYNCIPTFPENFSKIIRKITEGTSFVRLEGGDVGDVWDSDVFFHERMNWTDEQWWMDGHTNVLYPCMSLNILPKIPSTRR